MGWILIGWEIRRRRFYRFTDDCLEDVRLLWIDLDFWFGEISIKRVYEAAAIDGASAWTRFWKITFPMLYPAFFTVTVLAVGISFGIFTEVYQLTGGGPNFATNTVAKWRSIIKACQSSLGVCFSSRVNGFCGDVCFDWCDSVNY